MGEHNEQDGSGHGIRRDGQTAHSQQGEPSIRPQMSMTGLNRFGLLDAAFGL